MEFEQFTREELFELYKLEISRENEIRTRWRKSMEVYLTMLLTVFGGSLTLANVFKAKFLTASSLIGGGIIIVLLAITAYFHFKLDYKYQMEILSIQAKIEDLLGLTSPNRCNLPARWGNEALLPTRYYEDKDKPSTSEEFVSKMCALKRINFYPLIYLIFFLIGIGLIILGAVYCLKF
ncbi:MAG: hypothetical protein J1E56_07055 [Ruminococcus sp.]|nr:hypothetical protein [Ruminococcus sp.]